MNQPPPPPPTGLRFPVKRDNCPLSTLNRSSSRGLYYLFSIYFPYGDIALFTEYSDKNVLHVVKLLQMTGLTGLTFITNCDSSAYYILWQLVASYDSSLITNGDSYYKMRRYILRQYWFSVTLSKQAPTQTNGNMQMWLLSTKRMISRKSKIIGQYPYYQYVQSYLK